MNRPWLSLVSRIEFAALATSDDAGFSNSQKCTCLPPCLQEKKKETSRSWISVKWSQILFSWRREERGNGRKFANVS